jgi:protein-tyrosine phosphatase
MTHSRMVDLHSHILPAFDDGPTDWTESVAMARVAAEDGISTIVATPHVNFDYSFELPAIAASVREMNLTLAELRVPLAVAGGGEVAISRLAELTDAELRSITLAESDAVLVESPYSPGAVAVEEALFDLQVRGFQPILAHPERCPLFQVEPARLASLVHQGVYSSVSSGSLTGAFGSTVRRAALELLRLGLVHSVSSDAHGAGNRQPRLRPAIDAARRDLPGISGVAEWLTRDAPAALLNGEDPPARPEVALGRAPRWRRLTGRA